MGDRVEEQPALRPVRMGILTLALTLFGLMLFTLAMAAFQTVEVIRHLPDSRAGVGWIIGLIMIPTVITGVVSGLTAALGAYLGKRAGQSILGPLSHRRRLAIGAGFGGAIGSILFLLYLSWIYQNGAGLWILVLGYIATFGAYAGFTALWTRPRQTSHVDAVTSASSRARI